MEEAPQPREIIFQGENTDTKEIKNKIDSYFENLQKEGWTEKDTKKMWDLFLEKYRRSMKSAGWKKKKITNEYRSQITTELLAEIRMMTEGILKERKESLTPELLNRYGAEQEFLRRIEDIKETKKVVVLINFDLDGFKATNDTFGHLAGDRLLTQIGTNIYNAIKSEDVGIRFSGDEFGILISIPESKQDEIKAIVDRITKKIETKTKREDGTTQSISVGYTVVTPEMSEKENLFKESRKKADKASEISKLIRTKELLDQKSDLDSTSRIISSDKIEEYLNEEEIEKLSYIRQVMRPMQEVLKNKTEQEIVEHALECYSKLVEKK
ncbi:MAG: hypothetical protein COY69_02320 [Candidatus Magasanikbacteria bacterium CG_4_10_14_0_8_um_filter_32_14]|uniref:GGDEF domain-containing protein n=1 Tax=Candidatus Magasanikbacteria bacterium CG_4_10_14_0_8_um_filter_32_14 TaxID=1974640 RepID=A0A2M7R9R2_9BACT|nr:MAG: hypothetical protein COY69_02320 [Candidatus Magasanikbacteria bacterium CG_4_10_14_0_8_um_filter_32_14]